MLTAHKPSAAPVTHRVRGGAVAEEYYALVHWLRSARDLSSVARKSIGVTSCVAGAGVSTVALNLAVAAAQVSDQQVLLLDLSSTRGLHARRLCMSGDLGLREALNDVSRASSRAKASPIANLSLLAVSESGAPQPLSVDCGPVDDLLRAVEKDFGFVVVDLPTTESNLCFATAGLLSGTLMVMEAERTHAEAASRAKQRLVHAHANILGAILTNHRQHLPNWLDARL